MRKQVLIPILAVVLTVGAVYAAGPLYPVGEGDAISAVTTCTNASTAVTRSDISGGSIIAKTLVLSCTAAKTCGVSYVTGTTFANSPIKMINGGSITFPSSTYPFIPGTLYVIGDDAAVTYTNTLSIITK